MTLSVKKKYADKYGKDALFYLPGAFEHSREQPGKPCNGQGEQNNKYD